MPISAGYSTADTAVDVLIADPRARAVLDRHFPGMSSDPRIDMAKGMTLRALREHAPDPYPEAVFDAADRDLAEIPAQ